MSEPRQQENLIAYLDGELSDEAAASVEKTLAEEIGTRQEVERLTRAWELLDLLPEARASSDFTEKTLTAVRTRLALPAQSETDENDDDVIPGQGRERVHRLVRRTAAFLLLLFVAAVGFNSTFRKDSEPIDELLIELPVVERLDEYREAGDVEFLKALEQSGLFDAPHKPDPQSQRLDRNRD